jgi:hypothetical protein
LLVQVVVAVVGGTLVGLQELVVQGLSLVVAVAAGAQEQAEVLEETAVQVERVV